MQRLRRKRQQLKSNMADTDRLEKTVSELLEEIERLTKRIEALEKLVNFHEAIRRR